MSSHLVAVKLLHQGEMVGIVGTLRDLESQVCFEFQRAVCWVSTNLLHFERRF